MSASEPARATSRERTIVTPSHRAESDVRSEPEAWRVLHESTSREEFAAAWLRLQASQISGASVAVLVMGSGSVFRPAAVWPVGASVPGALATAVERSLETKRPISMLGRSEGGALERQVVATPVFVAGELRGALACELPAGRPEALQEVQAALRWGNSWFEAFELRLRDQKLQRERDSLLSALELVACTAERSGFQRAATALATELAVRFECERVSIGFVQDDRVHLRAVSHTAIFDKRSNTSRAIECAMDEAYDQEAHVLHPRPEGGAFQLDIAHKDLARATSSGAIVSVPFGREGDIYGVLTLQGAKPFSREQVDLCSVLGDLAGPLLELERREARPFGAKALEAHKRQLVRLTTPGSTAFKSGVLVLFLCALFLAFAKGTYRVTSDATIEPAQQRVVGAPFTGFLKNAPVRPGDMVRAGDLLFSMDARDMELQRQGLVSQEQQATKRYRRAMAERNAAEINIIRAQIDQIAAELELVDDRLSRTRVTSPVDGQIVEGDLSQSIGKPVERGEPLLQVAPTDSLRVVLFVPERDVEFVEVGQPGHLVLSTFPSDARPLTITRVTPVAQVHEEQNTFRVEAELGGESLELRPGMEGVAKIDVGRHHLIWNWSHEGLDWCRLFLWRWSP